MNTAAERERRREVMLVLVEGGGGHTLQFYKYTDVFTNTHPDTYTQSHLFQSRRRMGSGK